MTAKADVNVAAWLAEHDAACFFLSATSLMELEIGISRMKRRDTRQGQQLRMWMEHYLVSEFSGRILPLEAAVARRCAHLL